MEMVFYNSFTKYYKNITFQAKSLPCRLEIERNGSRYPSDSPFCSRTNFFEIFYFFFRKACPLRSGKGAVFAAGIYVPAAGERRPKLKNNQLYPKYSIPLCILSRMIENKTNYTEKNIAIVQA